MQSIPITFKPARWGYGITCEVEMVHSLGLEPSVVHMTRSHLLPGSSQCCIGYGNVDLCVVVPFEFLHGPGVLCSGWGSGGARWRFVEVVLDEWTH